jgi:hypothetical protein
MRRKSGGLLSNVNKPSSQLMGTTPQLHGDRMRASSPFLPRQSSLFERGLSPMLIPPVSNLQQAEFVSSEYQRTEEAVSAANVRGLAVDQKSFQHREGLGFASGVGYEYGGETSQPLVSLSSFLDIALGPVPYLILPVIGIGNACRCRRL